MVGMQKPNVWNVKYADYLFSKFIRERDPTCRRCWIEDSHDCSHYWGRGNSATRFDPKNCVGLCRMCHDIWEHQKNNEYKRFMVNWLGKKEYDELEHRARSFKRRREAIRECISFLKDIEFHPKRTTII